MINAARSLVIESFTWSAAVEAIALASMFAVVTVTFALRQLRRRLRVAA
jgi:hypothetical protein